MDTTPATASLQNNPGYYKAGVGMRLARLALRGAQALWPSLAVRGALRLFATPLPPKWLQRGRRWGSDWRIERWPFEDGALTLYVRAAASASAPTALLVHGWGGHAGHMASLAQALSHGSLHTVILEMPAHGRSPGSFSNLPQFARAIEYVAARLQQQGHTLELLAAHSLGATAAAYAVSRGTAVRRLVLLAPAASPSRYTRYFAQVFGLSEPTRAAMQQRIEAREAVLMRQFEPASLVARVRVPTLVVHDRSDRVNAFADGQAYAAAIEGAQLAATEGLGHRRMLNDIGVLERVAAFVSTE